MAGNIRMLLLTFSVLIIRLRDGRPRLYILLFEYKIQSVINSSARMVFSSSRFDHIPPLLRQLHWLKVAERIVYKLAF